MRNTCKDVYVNITIYKAYDANISNKRNGWKMSQEQWKKLICLLNIFILPRGGHDVTSIEEIAEDNEDIRSAILEDMKEEMKNNINTMKSSRLDLIKLEKD